MELRWCWRPVPLGTHSTAGQLLAGVSSSSPSIASNPTKTKTLPSRGSRGSSGRERRGGTAGTDNAAYFQVGSRYRTRWEVRVTVSATQEVFVRRASAEAGSALTRRVLDRSPDWIVCNVLLPAELPPKATLEVFAICEDLGEVCDNHDRKSGSEQFVAFEAKDFRLFSAPLAALPVGGDDNVFDVNTTAALGENAVSFNKLSSVFPSLQTKTVLRWFAWTHHFQDAQLTFESKLVTIASESTVGSPIRANDDDSAALALPNYHTIGYAWAVYVLGAEGSLRLAAEDLCGGGEDPAAAVAASSGAGSLLQAWRWRRHSAALGGLRCGDAILLVAKALSEQPAYPTHLLARCAVCAKASVLCKNDSIHKEFNVIGVAQNSAFVWHDISPVLPM